MNEPCHQRAGPKPEWAMGVVAVAVAAFVISSCQTAPVTHRNQLILMDRGTELSLGREIYQDVKDHSPLVNDPRLISLVERVGDKIARAAGGEEYQWEFILVDSETPNAYCIPGGKVVVNTGILPVAKTEAGLAAIIAHEAGHAMARHGAERHGHAHIVTLGADLVARGLGQKLAEKTKMRLALGLDFLFSLAFPFSKTHELEADEIGLTYMARAGYDPREALYLWERFLELDESKKRPFLEFLSTHPTDKTRIQKLMILIPTAMREYNKSPRLGKGEDIL